MSLLFETIKCKNRQLYLLAYHQQRVDESLSTLLGIKDGFSLADSIKIPENLSEGIFRCRISYSEKIEKIDFFEYIPKHPKIIQLHEDPSLSYSFKFEDRSCFSMLQEKYPTADEVIILKENRLTDATFANLAFFDGTKWFTPHSYLLKGTQRSFLLQHQLIEEAEILLADLSKFKKIAFINAMRSLAINYSYSVEANRLIIK